LRHQANTFRSCPPDPVQSLLRLARLDSHHALVVWNSPADQEADRGGAKPSAAPSCASPRPGLSRRI